MHNAKRGLTFSLLILCIGLMSQSVKAALNPTNYFQCQVASTGQVLSENTSSTAVVRVNLTPELQAGQNLVVDLTKEILCRNNTIETTASGGTSQWGVNTRLTSGSTFSGALANFTGSVFFRTETFPLPLSSGTNLYAVESRSYSSLPLRLYLSPIGAAGGVVIKAGTLVATLNMIMYTTNPNRATANFTWNIYANNDVVIPTGGCDVSARDVTVSLPVYPGAETPVPLTVHCASTQSLSYYLTGTLASGSTNTFTNTYTGTTAASGVGIQLLRNGSAIPPNQNISLGAVGTSAVSLGLTTNYALTTGRLTAGKVQSVIGVTFVYD